MFEILHAKRPPTAIPHVNKSSECLTTEFATADIERWNENSVHAAGQAKPERVHRTFSGMYREEVLNQYLFRDLDEIHDGITYWWLIDYNSDNRMKAWAAKPPQKIENLTLERCA